ncbi:hypothetical protein LguiA_021512 [Lonicera macranthoides]
MAQRALYLVAKLTVAQPYFESEFHFLLERWKPVDFEQLYPGGFAENYAQRALYLVAKLTVAQPYFESEFHFLLERWKPVDFEQLYPGGFAENYAQRALYLVAKLTVAQPYFERKGDFNYVSSSGSKGKESKDVVGSSEFVERNWAWIVGGSLTDLLITSFQCTSPLSARPDLSYGVGYDNGTSKGFLHVDFNIERYAKHDGFYYPWNEEDLELALAHDTGDEFGLRVFEPIYPETLYQCGYEGGYGGVYGYLIKIWVDPTQNNTFILEAPSSSMIFAKAWLTQTEHRSLRK